MPPGFLLVSSPHKNQGVHEISRLCSEPRSGLASLAHAQGSKHWLSRLATRPACARLLWVVDNTLDPALHSRTLDLVVALMHCDQQQHHMESGNAELGEAAAPGPGSSLGAGDGVDNAELGCRAPLMHQQGEQQPQQGSSAASSGKEVLEGTSLKDASTEHCKEGRGGSEGAQQGASKEGGGGAAGRHQQQQQQQQPEGSQQPRASGVHQLSPAGTGPGPGSCSPTQILVEQGLLYVLHGVLQLAGDVSGVG